MLSLREEGTRCKDVHQDLCPLLGASSCLHLPKDERSDCSKSPCCHKRWGGKKKKADALTVCSNDSKLTNLVLQTFWVVAKGPRGVQKCRVLLDGGAHLSYINQQSAEALGLIAKGVERQNVGVFGGDVQEKIMQKMEITLKKKLIP